MTRYLALVLAAVCGLASPETALAQRADRLNLVIVVDGLRPDSITAENTPNLFRLREEGVSYLNSHAVFPTVTRANATTLATGTYPGKNGITGNTLYHPGVDPAQAFSNDNYQNLLKLDAATNGRMVLATSLAEILTARGIKFAAVSSGSSGSALLLDPKAPKGVALLVNSDFQPGLVAYPPAANDEILRRFGAPPKKGGTEQPFDASITWAQSVLADYVLPDYGPAVVFNWLTEPDHTQHAFGAGAPVAQRSIHHADEQIGRVLQKIAALGRADQTNIFVVSDHGFGFDGGGVDVTGELIKAKLKQGPDSPDLVVASNGYSVALHIKDRNAEKIRRVVAFLQAQPWTGVVFTAPSSSGSTQGQVGGTFSLDFIHLLNTARGPDIVFTFPWSSAKNPYGVSGIDTGVAGATGPVAQPRANHGSMSPWNVRNTFLLWGADFKRGAVVRAPASNVDVTPTILALLGIHDVRGLDGRVLSEAMKSGPDEEQVAIETRTVTTTAGNYKAVLQVTEVGTQRYVDKSWRIDK